MFQGTYRSKAGSILGFEYGESHTDVARKLFARYPNAQTVQVCNAYFDEHKKRLRGNGNNIQWINRHDV